MPSIFSIFYLTRRSLAILGMTTLLLTSAACNPTWNWRESRSSDAPVSVLLPAKPSSHARTVDLNGLEVTMNMTATEINGANFALGCDMVIAARSASFVQAFAKIGLIPDCGGTWLLPGS